MNKNWIKNIIKIIIATIMSIGIAIALGLGISNKIQKEPEEHAWLIMWDINMTNTFLPSDHIRGAQVIKSTEILLSKSGLIEYNIIDNGSTSDKPDHFGWIQIK